MFIGQERRGRSAAGVEALHPYRWDILQQPQSARHSKGGTETVRLALSLSPLRRLPLRIALGESRVAPNVIDSKNEKMSASYKERLPLTKDSHYTLHCDSWQTAKRMLT